MPLANPRSSTGFPASSTRQTMITPTWEYLFSRSTVTWAEMQAFAEKLTKRDASGNTTQWGVQIPSSGFPYWLFQGLTTQAGAILMNP